MNNVGQRKENNPDDLVNKIVEEKILFLSEYTTKCCILPINSNSTPTRLDDALDEAWAEEVEKKIRDLAKQYDVHLHELLRGDLIRPILSDFDEIYKIPVTLDDERKDRVENIILNNHLYKIAVYFNIFLRVAWEFSDEIEGRKEYLYNAKNLEELPSKMTEKEQKIVWQITQKIRDLLIKISSDSDTTPPSS